MKLVEDTRIISLEEISSPDKKKKRLRKSNKIQIKNVIKFKDEPVLPLVHEENGKKIERP